LPDAILLTIGKNTLVNNAQDRSELRARLLAQRRAMNAGQRIAAAENLAASLQNLPQFSAVRTIAGYWATDGEMSLHALVARLLARGQIYCLPQIFSNRQMRFAVWRTGDALETSRFGIPQPVVEAAQLAADGLDVVLLPLLGFDRRGNRLGTGAGYYDRCFAFLRERPRPAQPLLVGIGYSNQELDAIAAQAWDVPMDFVASDSELIACPSPLD
jgi:5-formyltetrahydrofolate cyclo-ligase